MTLGTRRIRAWLFDEFLGIAILIVGIFCFQKDSAISTYFLRLFLVLGVSYGILQDSFGGAGIGKRVYKIYVQDENGKPAGFFGAAFRQTILFIPLVGFLDALSYFFSKDSQRFSDRILGYHLAIFEEGAKPSIRFISLMLSCLVLSLVPLSLLIKSQPPKKLSESEMFKERLNYPNGYDNLAGSDRLAAASERGDLAEMKKIIGSGVNPNRVDHFTRTALEYSIVSGCSDCFEYLLSKGANPCEKTGQAENGGQFVEKIADHLLNLGEIGLSTRRVSWQKMATQLKSAHCH